MSSLRLLGAIVIAGGLGASRLSAQPFAGVGADFGGLLRAGQWSELYGPALTTAFRVELGTESGWLLSAHPELIYGREVLIDPLVGLRTDVGILGDDGAEASPVTIDLKARGFRMSVLGGRAFPFGTPGLAFRALAGPTYLTHNIRIQDDATLTSSNLRSDYKAGYDRRAAGWGVSAEIGLEYRPPQGSAFFFLSAQGHLAATRPLRSVQFDTGDQAPAAGTDFGLGLKIGIVATLLTPTRQRDADQIYY